MKHHGHRGLTLLLATHFLVFLPLLYALPITGMMIAMTLSPNKEFGLARVSRRGITHTVWFAVFVATFIFLAIGSVSAIVRKAVITIGGGAPAAFQPWMFACILSIGGFFGVISHIIGDAIVGGDSKPAVTPFWPVSRLDIRLGITDHRNPFVNEALFRIMLLIDFLIVLARIRPTPIYFQ